MYAVKMKDGKIIASLLVGDEAKQDIVQKISKYVTTYHGQLAQGLAIDLVHLMNSITFAIMVNTFVEQEEEKGTSEDFLQLLTTVEDEIVENVGKMIGLELGVMEPETGESETKEESKEGVNDATGVTE